MSRKDFVTLVLSVIGGLLFSIGMVMCLTDIGSFTGGVILSIVGAIVLLIMVLVHRKMEGKPPIHVTVRLIGGILLAIVGALTLGAGMCLVMVWGHMVSGIVVGVIGIVLLLFLIPLANGLRD